MSKVSEEEIIKILKKHKLKVTPQRLSICKIVLSSTEHPSADQVYNLVKKEHKTMSLATVYKTLNLLEHIGLVNELRFNGDFTRYDPKSTLHINIVCPKCMKIKDYESDKLKENWKQIIAEIRGEIKGQRIDVYVICEDCYS